MLTNRERQPHDTVARPTGCNIRINYKLPKAGRTLARALDLLYLP